MSPALRWLPTLLLVTSWSTACVAPRAPSGEGPDAGAGALVELRDARGDAVDRRALPRRPRLLLDLPAPPQPESILLLQGAGSAALLQDASARPLRAAHRERALPLELGWSEGVAIATPTAALPPGARLSLLVTAWVVDGPPPPHWPPLPWALELAVSGDPGDGVGVRHALPADGSQDVPPALEALLVSLDGHLAPLAGPPLTLHDVDGQPVPLRHTEVACVTLDDAAQQCLSLAPEAALRPGVMHTLTWHPDARDLRGGRPAAYRARFRTAVETRANPPALEVPNCPVDEVALPGGCALVDDQRVRLRMLAGTPGIVSATLGGATRTRPAPRGAATLGFELPLAPGAHAVQLSVRDLAGKHALADAVLPAPGPLPTVNITEVRSDPLGAEPRQEFVELHNFGSAAVALTGLLLADDPGREGAPLPEAILSPGATVLVVGADFDAQDEADPPLPAGVPLLRLDGAALGRSGLSNAGETIVLRTASGHRLSTVAPVQTGAGHCLVRREPRSRSGARDAFAVAPPDACDPGRVGA